MTRNPNKGLITQFYYEDFGTCHYIYHPTFSFLSSHSPLQFTLSANLASLLRFWFEKMGSNDKNSSTNVAEFVLIEFSCSLNSEDKIDIINALKDKLDDLASKRTIVLENLCPSSEYDELEKKFFEERAALEAKYQKLYEPLYTKRYEIVNGVGEVEENTTEAESEDKGVPEFWLTVLKNNLILAGEITEHDEAALKFLKDIKWSKVDNGFKLEFHFDTNNPYFKNSVLTKTYDMSDEADEIILEKAIGRPIVVEEEDEDTDEDDDEELQNILEEDYHIGLIIKDKIIPHAVSWFTGEAPQDEFVEIDYDDELDEEDEEDDEDAKDEEEIDGNKEKDEHKTEKKKSGEVLSGEGN
ncbi:nucleosome assembly protein 1 [Striga asiatica]|uniref:Nucleosome assembly protein 1 n=1 Tax=Striga asiatica TaxID=4170 RepID=A0A5A7R143_STRAF|nr:nucleosome assembly protein 1 [Striga asiatica]